MRVLARRTEGYAHAVETGDGHEVVVDEPVDQGGTDTGPRPNVLLAASLASCTAITMEMYAGVKGWDIGRVGVAVDVEFEGPVPSAFAVSVELPDHLDEEQRRRLLVIAGKCPVHKVIAAGAEVTVSAAGGTP